MPNAANCSSCGAPLIWARTAANNKRIPLDFEPEKRLVRQEDGRFAVVDTYKSHFATCPNANKHRKRG